MVILKIWRLVNCTKVEEMVMVAIVIKVWKKVRIGVNNCKSVLFFINLFWKNYMLINNFCSLRFLYLLLTKHFQTHMNSFLYNTARRLTLVIYLNGRNFGGFGGFTQNLPN